MPKMHQLQNGWHWLKGRLYRKTEVQGDHPSCQYETDKPWLDLRFHSNGQIKMPEELENEMQDPPSLINEKLLDKIQGCLIGMALGDALGAHVEFRPRQYLLANQVTDLEGGGTWGLKKGQFTDDTSMALCLGNSLVSRRGFVPYDQLVRYKWWHQHGYMSSTGQCFDIGAATSQSIGVFEHNQMKFAKRYNIPLNKLDYLSDIAHLQKFKVHCSESGVAGNGALMRLAPVPLFFHKHRFEAIYYSGYSGVITHGDEKASDACRYYGALIFAALNGYTKEQLLDKDFYTKHQHWFDGKPLCHEIRKIAEGSYQKQGGYDDGIRGKGYVVDSLEAALWAFWSDDNSFETGALAAVNLGDDTDTTACIYGQLAGAYYGYRELPRKWIEQVYAKKFILNLSKWIAYEGGNWQKSGVILPSNSPSVGTTRSSSVENLTSEEAARPFVRPRSKSRSDTLSLGRKAVERYTPISDNNMTSGQHPSFLPNSNGAANSTVTKKPTTKEKVSEFFNVTPKTRKKCRIANPVEKETKTPTENTYI